MINIKPLQYYFKDDGLFPNSHHPVLLYKKAMDLPFLFPGNYIVNWFEKNDWSNSWKSGILTYHHYHSITHEALGVFKGGTILLLGGDNGQEIEIGKGDILIIPAGVPHKNLGEERQISCVGAYPQGRKYDLNLGKPGERPKADFNIAHIPIPETDPWLGINFGLPTLWKGKRY